MCARPSFASATKENKLNEIIDEQLLNVDILTKRIKKWPKLMFGVQD